MRDFLKNSFLKQKLDEFSLTNCSLKGIHNDRNAWVLIKQIEESKRRSMYINAIKDRVLDSSATDPSSFAFDPIKRAIDQNSKNNIDEAFWMAFLATYFGRHKTLKWQLCREVVNGESTKPWTWEYTKSKTNEFQNWIDHYKTTVVSQRSTAGFGNHRKYESLKRTGAAVKSYIDWVGPTQSHVDCIKQHSPDDCQTDLFDQLYHSLDNVLSFGRTGKFDYLTLLTRIGLIEASPKKPYLKYATGPLEGARLLIDGTRKTKTSVEDMEVTIINLCTHLSLSCDIVEDALCNWQKNPRKFIPFRG